MTTNSYQSERVDAMKVYQAVILGTMKDRSQLRKMGVDAWVELLIDGIEVSFTLPKVNRHNPDYDYGKAWDLVLSVFSSIQDIMKGACRYQLESKYNDYTVSHTYICQGEWDISWPGLMQLGGVFTFDDGGARL